MRAVLLAAGMGTRLGNITKYIPKCIVPIHGIPLAFYWIEFLQKNGVSNILMNVNWLSSVVEKAINNSPFRGKISFFRETELWGTGGTLLKNTEFWNNEDLFVAHADNLSHFSFADFLKIHHARKLECQATMMVFESPDPGSCGIVELDKGGNVIGFHEKVAHPPGNLANAAVYIFSPKVLQELKNLDREKIDLSTEVIPRLIGKIQTFKNDSFHWDIGTPSNYLTASRLFKFPFPPTFCPCLEWWEDLIGKSEFQSIQHQLSLD